jgi:hypothetical protein
VRRLPLLVVALLLAPAGCSPLGGSGPAIVTIRCGSQEGVGWATPIELSGDGWRSYVITSADLVDDCVHGEPVELPAEMVIENDVDLVRVRAGSSDLVGHVYNSDGGSGLASVVVREGLDWLEDGSRPRVGDDVTVGRPGFEPRNVGRLTRADGEGLAVTGELTRLDRGAPIIDEAGDVIGTVVFDDGRLRGVPVTSLCRFLLDCS